MSKRKHPLDRRNFPVASSRREYLDMRISPEPNTGCWAWMGNYSSYGYGVVPKGHLFSQSSNAHRAVYVEYVASVSAGLDVDHKCQNRWCVNPAHMEPVSPEENTRRMCAANYRPKRDWLVLPTRRGARNGR